MTRKKAVAKKESGTLAFTEEAGQHLSNSTSRGNENVATTDMIIPRLEIVQSLSPQRKKKDGKYIEGADDGDIYNTVTNELMERPCLVVPVQFKKEWMLWVPRDGGGDNQGFRGAFDSEADAKDRQKELAEEGEEVEVVDGHQHFVLVVRDTGKIEEAVITMTRTKMKVSRRWNSMIRLGGGDRFSRGYKLDTVEEESPKGDYFNFAVSAAGFTPEEVYKKAEALYDAVSDGSKTIHRDAAEEVKDDGEI